MKLNDKYFLNPAHLELAQSRYFLKDGDGNLVEKDIDEVFCRVVDYVYQNDPDHKEEALKLRREKKIIDAGRILAQAGTKTKNLYNCFCIGFGDENNPDPDTREAISELKRQHFAVQSQGGGCVDGATPICTKELGIVNIQDIPEFAELSEFDKQFPISGYKTISYNKNMNVVEEDKITHIWKFNVKKDDVRIINFDSGSIKTSAWHPFFTVDVSDKNKRSVSVKRADELTSSDHVLSLGPHSHFDFDHGFGWLLGYIVGNGSIDVIKGDHRIRLCDSNVKTLDRAKKIFERYGHKSDVSKDSNENMYTLTVTSALAATHGNSKKNLCQFFDRIMSFFGPGGAKDFKLDKFNEIPLLTERVSNVEVGERDEIFYDFTVEKNNNYIAFNGNAFIFIHNTGINFSVLRPNGSVCKSTQSRSSGTIGFMTDLSYQSANIQQGGNRCLTKDALVAMADGTWRKIIDIRPGDEIVAFDKSTKKITMSKVVKFYENGVQPIFKIKMAGGHYVKATENHRWLGRDRKYNYVASTINNMPKNHKKIACVNAIDIFGTRKSKWAGILGYLLGDGCFIGETIKLSSTDDKIKKVFEDQLPENTSIWENEGGVHFSLGREFQEYLRTLSLYHCLAHEKFIPDEVFEYCKEDLIKIINGLIATNGWVTKEEVGYCFTSERLVRDLRRLLMKFGISGHIQIDNGPRKGKVQRPFWRMRIRHPDSCSAFGRIFNVPSEQKRKEINLQQISEDCVFHKVEEIEPAGKELTFCIEIDHPDHLFIVDGFISHNSGANMAVLEDSHPDLLEFVTKKSKSNWENIRKFATIKDEDEFAYFQWQNYYALQMFNISVFLSDDFMERVKNNSKDPWVLEWKGIPWHLWDFEAGLGPKTGKSRPKKITVVAPDQTMAEYKAASQVPFFNKSSLSLSKGPYDLTANEWFDKICQNAWEDGCPGVIFIDTARKYHNGEYYNPVNACNPCSEQILSIGGSCCLTSLCLPSFYSDGRFQWEEFKKSIYAAVRGLDNVIDFSETGEKVIDRAARDERRIGVGTTGIAELLILEGLKYSSEKAAQYIKKLLAFLRNNAYRASVELAKEKGAFPAFNYDGLNQSKFFQSLPEEIKKDVKKYGLRNITLITQAPTGTTGTMVGFSQGCEPYFSMAYKRNSKVGVFMDGSPAFKKWMDENIIDYSDYNFSLDELKKDYNVPDYFEEAHNISWKDHLRIQGVFANYVDSSVSKTINLPNSATTEDVKLAYLTAYNMGIKSTTVYRDGSKQQILEHMSKNSDENRPKDIINTNSPKRPSELECDIHTTSVKGQKWIVLVGLLNDRPYEMFCTTAESFDISAKYKKGKIIKNGHGRYNLDLGDFIIKDISSYLKTDEHRVITRLISMCLRHGIGMKHLSEQLNRVDGSVVDFSKAVLRVLKKYVSTEEAAQDLICEKCGSTNVILSGGCPICLNCNFSKCG